MIELPEVLTIAKQMNDELKERRVEASNRGNSPTSGCSTTVPQNSK